VVLIREKIFRLLVSFRGWLSRSKDLEDQMGGPVYLALFLFSRLGNDG